MGHSEKRSQVSIPRITGDAVLSMAAFMKDFRPAHVFKPEIGAARELHPMWVSALVGEAVRRACPDWSVVRLKVRHLAEAHEGGALRAKLEMNGIAAGPGGTIRLQVTNGRGKVLVVAVAEVAQDREIH